MKRVGALLFGISLMMGAHGQMAIPGEYGVSPSGAATYNIPIQAPPGLAGIEPKLALSYNSQSGNGQLGVGWNLSGLSAITRCPQTSAQDGVRTGVKFAASDRFCLDGKRLMLVSGTYGAAGSTYQTEIESFVQVAAVGVVTGIGATGPASFTVKTKNGLTMQYGATSDSQIQVSTTLNTVRVWALNQISDVKGNYLNVTYTKDCTDNTNSTTCSNTFNGGYRPSAIVYTGNSTQTPNISPAAKITFGYNLGRADVRTFYQAGYRFVDRARLTSIVTSANGTNVLKYDLSNYENGGDTGRSRLKSIKLCDGAGTQCVPATSMSFPAAALSSGPVRSAFQQATLDTTLTSTSGVSPSGMQNNVYINGGKEWLVADFRGVGHSDLLHLSGTNSSTQSTAKLWAFNGSGPFTVTDRGPVFELDSSKNCPNTSDYHSHAKWGAYDVDGDGLADIVRSELHYRLAWLSTCSGNTWYYQHSTSMLRNSGGSSFASAVVLDAGPSGSTNNVSGSPPVYPAGIMYGDTLGALVISSIAYDSWQPYTVYLGGTSVSSSPDNPSASLASGNTAAFTIDVDGDGLLDVIRFEDNYRRVWFNKTNTPSSSPSISVSAAYYDNVADSTAGSVTSGFSKGQWFTADLNGDGLTDLIHIPVTSGNLQWWINKGDGNFAANAAPFAADPFAPQTGTWQIVDYNGDGQAELIHLADASTGKLYVWAFNGNGFTIAQMAAGSGAADSALTNGLWKSADLIGDGTTDLIHFKDNSGNYVIWKMPRPDLDIPTSISNGLGKSVAFTTKTLPQMLNQVATNGGSYTRDAPTAAPATVTTLIPATRVVTNVNVSNGLGGTRQEGYNYDSVRLDRAGRGLTGFAWIESIDLATGYATRTTYSQTFPYVGMPVKVTKGVSHAVPDNLAQQINTLDVYCQATGTTNSMLDTSKACTVAATGSGKQRYFPYVSTSLTKAWDLDSSALPQTSTSYANLDAYGNIQRITTNTLTGTGASTSYYKQTDYSFYNDTTNWRLGNVVKKVDTAAGPDVAASVIPGSGGLPAAPAPITPQQRTAAIMSILNLLLLD